MPDRALAALLAARIAADGPMPLVDYMRAVNAHYYGARDPFGVDGDFVTAPEISQLFGEVLGGWIADLAMRAGAGERFALVELGPGRGTLMADARRVLARARLSPPVHLVETSAVLRTGQAALVPDAHWHDGIDTLPVDRPLLVIANEFFDALPIRQFERTADGWRERQVTLGQSGGFRLTSGGDDMSASVPAPLRDAPRGAVVETCPDATGIAAALAARLAVQGGALLAIDYGYRGPAPGDTLQAVRRQGFADPLASPGEADLTAHVDFTALGDALAAAGMTVHPLATQGAFLWSLGLGERTAALARANPQRADELAAQATRLAGRDGMGDLFRVLAATAPGWPVPAGV